MTAAGRTFGAFLSALISAFVVLLIAEAILRVAAPVPIIPQMYSADAHTIFRTKAHMKERSTLAGGGAWSWTTNSLGFRGTEEFAVPKPARTRRILVLGDSFTFGFGVNDDETYAAALERNLDSMCVGSRVEVVNAGVSAFSTSQQLAMLEHAAAQLEPDVVVVGFFINDPQDNIDKAVHSLVGDSLVSSSSTTASAYEGVLQAKRFVNAIPGYDWLVRHSMLVNWLRRAYFASRQIDPTANPLRWGMGRWRMEGEPGAAPDSASLAQQWRLTELLYRRFQDRVAAMGGELVVALLPDDSTVARYEEGRRERAETFVRMTQLCQRAHLQCVDAAAAIAAAVEPTRIGELYLPNEGHFSAAGHLMTAKALVPTVARALGCSAPHDATPATS